MVQRKPNTNFILYKNSFIKRQSSMFYDQNIKIYIIMKFSYKGVCMYHSILYHAFALFFKMKKDKKYVEKKLDAKMDMKKKKNR